MNRKGVLARLVVLTTLAAALVLVLAACGASTSLGETPTTENTGGGSSSSGGGSTINVTEKEFSITPDKVSAPAGTITFQIKNTGAVAHDITVTVNGTDHASPLVQPGKSETWSVTIPDPGTYDMFCSVPGHKEAGMDGTLTVTGS